MTEFHPSELFKNFKNIEAIYFSSELANLIFKSEPIKTNASSEDFKKTSHNKFVVNTNRILFDLNF